MWFDHFNKGLVQCGICGDMVDERDSYRAQHPEEDVLDLVCYKCADWLDPLNVSLEPGRGSVGDLKVVEPRRRLGCSAMRPRGNLSPEVSEPPYDTPMDPCYSCQTEVSSDTEAELRAKALLEGL